MGSERCGAKVRQPNLLNLGRHFDVAQSDWPLLCLRIDELFTGQLPLLSDCPLELESHAQRISAQLLALPCAHIECWTKGARSRVFCARIEHASTSTAPQRPVLIPQQEETHIKPIHIVAIITMLVVTMSATANPTSHSR